MEMITARDNKNIKEYIKLMNNKSERDEQRLFVLEGVKVVLEAFSEGAMVDKLFITEDCFLKHKAELKQTTTETETFFISKECAAKMSGTKSPQGIFCVCKKKENTVSGDYKAGILLCSLSDPGNLGTIIRTAEGLGITDVFLSKDCCDIYNPKVVRSTMGSILRLNISVVDDVKSFVQQSTATTIAAVVGDADTPQTITYGDKNLLLIGNESKGIDSEIVALCNKKITIPMKGRSESFNASVAAGILMWEIVAKLW